VSGDGIVHRSSIRLSDYPAISGRAGLQGGADISPQCYGEEPLHPDWAGDRLRDAYEMELLHEFMEAGKPVLGICRGAQLINVALGGTLYQDIATQVTTGSGASPCRLRPSRPRHRLGCSVPELCASLYPDSTERAGRLDPPPGHQGRSAAGCASRRAARDDGLIEAVRLEGKPYVLGVQWHPEFHPPGSPDCSTARHPR
jgi:putative glutamine amidotransferase